MRTRGPRDHRTTDHSAMSSPSAQKAVKPEAPETAHITPTRADRSAKAVPVTRPSEEPEEGLSPARGSTEDRRPHQANPAIVGAPSTSQTTPVARALHPASAPRRWTTVNTANPARRTSARTSSAVTQRGGEDGDRTP